MLNEQQVVLAINAFYSVFLGRQADPQGMQGWLQLWRDGMDLQKIAQGIVLSTEYQQKVNFNSSSQEDLIEKATSISKKLLTNHKLVIVDVGAQNLAYESHIYAPLFDYSTKVIGFEPLEHRCNERQAVAENTELKIYPFFIGDGREHTFHINDPDATSSLFSFNTALTQAHIDLESLSTVTMETVQTVTLYDALKDESEVHFLKLDIQGAELQVLENAAEVLDKVLVIHCEVSFMEIYKNQPFFSEVELFLRKLGFDLIDLTSQCKYPYTHTKFSSSRDRLGWADAVFFKRLDENSTYVQRVIQSVIALAVYKKMSLASWVVSNNCSVVDEYTQLFNIKE